MPLVTGGGNKITVEIDGKVDALIKDIDKLDKEFDQFIETTKKAEQGAGLTVKNATSSWTEFRSAYSTVLDIVRTGAQIWNQNVGELINYNDQVQKLSVITGQSSEEVSRQIQLADDLRVSYDTLSRSLQFASRKGIDTSIDGLVKLGEQYKKLPEGIQRTQFLMEKFGRSGIEMNKILSQTSDTIRNLAANTPEGLIISDADQRAITQYNQQVDQLTDSFTAFKMQAAKDTLPFVSRVFNELNKNIEKSGTLVGVLRFGFDDLYRAIFGTNDATNELATTSNDAADGLDNLDASQQAADESAKQLSSSLQTILSNMFSINQQNEKYADTIASLAKSDDELAAKKNQLTLQMWEEQRAGKLTNDEYLRYVQQIDDVNKSIEENQQKRKDAADQIAKASNKQVYDLVQQRLAADGLISAGEFEYLQNLAVQKGLVTKADADQAIQASRTADQLVSNFEKTQPVMDTTLQTMRDIAAFNGTVVNFGVNFTQTGSAGAAASGYRPMNYANVTSYNQTGFGTMHSRDSGGPGMAGTPYMIGKGAQPEVFVPNQSGQFIPNADKKGWGSIYNIVINNPKVEKSENSIRSALKKLSFVGVAQ